MISNLNVLKSKLRIQPGKQPIAEHHISGRLFPFYTRNPERVKYKDDFNEIVGIVTRASFGLQPILHDISKIHLQNITEKVEIDNDIDQEEIIDLFSINFDNIPHPYLYRYYPVLLETKSNISEAKGKELLGIYITKLLKLDENDEWKKFITFKQASDLYEEIYLGSLPQLEKSLRKEENFHFFNQKQLVNSFSKDLNVLMKNEKMFNENIHLLISYYYFYYVLQQSFKLIQEKEQNYPLWFAYDKEKVSNGRKCVQYGYKKFNDASKELLVNNDLIDYLNALIDDERYYSYSEIVSDENIKNSIITDLILLNQAFSEVLDKEFEDTRDFKKQVKQLKTMIKRNVSAETSSRYRKSFDEFIGLNFIKNRGRLGYVLNATQEFILMFVNIIIGDKKKILLKQLFEEFENRGIFFDSQSKKEITEFFEEVNILEKLSDSGDAQYVKSLL